MRWKTGPSCRLDWWNEYSSSLLMIAITVTELTGLRTLHQPSRFYARRVSHTRFFDLGTTSSSPHPSTILSSYQIPEGHIMNTRLKMTSSERGDVPGCAEIVTGI